MMKKAMSMIYLDFKKAFAALPPERLIYNVSKF